MLGEFDRRNGVAVFFFVAATQFFIAATPS
jgi:hypothetical protein